MGDKKIPRFDDPEEEARFWDGTSLDEVDETELEEVEIERPSRPLSATLAVRFDEPTVRALRELAAERGLGVTQLVRSWVVERLRDEGFRAAAEAGSRAARGLLRSEDRGRATRGMFSLPRVPPRGRIEVLWSKRGQLEGPLKELFRERRRGASDESESSDGR